jgi:hypothetical protein
VDDDQRDTSSDFLSAGLAGEFAFVAVLTVLIAAVALAIVALTDASAARVFPLAFSIGGGVIVIGGLLSATEKMPYWYSPATRRAAFKMSYVYAAIGVGFVLVGVVLDALL